MRAPHRAGVVAIALAAAAAAAHADLDVVLGNGDAVRGSLLPASEVETFRICCPEGARITAKLRSGRGRSRLVLRLLDPSGAELVSRSGRSARIARQRVDATGEHAVVVESLTSGVSDDYTLTVSWRSPRRDSGSISLPANGVATYEFAADADADVSLRLRPRRGSAAVPALVRVDGSLGSSRTLDGGTTASFRATEADTYTLLVENTADAAGDVSVSARIRPSRRQRRLLAATSAEIPPGTTVLAAAVMDERGGRLDAPGGSVLDGARVTVPFGALARPAIVVLGAAGDLTPPKPEESTPATAALVVGPFLASFADDLRPTIELSYAATGGPPENRSLVVLAAEAYLAAEPVTGTSTDVAERTVSFPAARFRRFQAFYVRQPDVPAPFALVGGADEELGKSVVISGTFVYAGAPGAEGPGGESSAGAVRIFEEVGASWIERTTLFGPAAAEGDRFGDRMALARGTDGVLRLFVSAPGRTGEEFAEQGTVHVFAGSGSDWALESSVVPPPPDPGASAYGRFALDGLTAGDDDTFVAKAQRRYQSGGEWRFATDGSFFLCRLGAGGWVVERRLTGAAPEFPSAVRGGEWFANLWSSEPVPAFPEGSLHESLVVYDAPGTSWTETARLTQTSPALRLDQFAVRVAVDGDAFATTAWAMGSDKESEQAYHTSIAHGRAYFGRRTVTGWEIEARIDVPFVPGAGPTPWDRLGPAVVLQGDVAAAATGREPRARVYRRVGGIWSEALQLDATPDLGTNHWNSEIAIDGPRLVLGAGFGPALPGADPPLVEDARGGIVIWLLPW